MTITEISMSVAPTASEIEPPKSFPHSKPVVSAVIPCLNEELTLGLCIEKALLSFAELGVEGEVVVADNGSTDRSVEIALQFGVRVVHERRKGYGAALYRGITESRGEIIVMADADDSYDWAAIAPLVRKIGEGYDLVMGNRFKGGIRAGAMPRLHRYLGNPVLSLVARVAFRADIGDFHCGMRAFTRKAFERMQLRTTGMEFATEMVANASHQGLRITEVPVVLYPDKRDRAPHLRSFRDGWRHLRFILTYAPDYLYLVPGLLLLLPGLGLELLLSRGPVTIHSAYLGIHFLALGSLLTLVGFNVINLGVLAKTLMAQRYSGIKSRTVRIVRQRFSLEAGLLTGAALCLTGTSIDIGVAVKWITEFGAPMEATVHLTFVATTALILGLNLICSSFLLNMILVETGSPGND
jgi:glycosyltransferase involved in cell wall biosynthesis